MHATGLISVMHMVAVLGQVHAVEILIYSFFT